METAPQPAEKPAKKPPVTRESRFETFFAISCILSSVVILRLVNDTTLWNSLIAAEGTRAVAGTLLRDRGRVRHKPTGSTVWHDVPGREIQVSYGDTIFTGDDGIAQLKLSSSGKGAAVVQPNSLIVVKQPTKAEEKGQWLSTFLKVVVAPRNEAAVEIKSGKVKLELAAGSKPIQLQSQGKVLELRSGIKGGSVEVSTDASNPAAPLSITPDSETRIAIRDMKKPEVPSVVIESGNKAVVDTAPKAADAPETPIARVEVAQEVPKPLRASAPVEATAPSESPSAAQPAAEIVKPAPAPVIDAEGRREVTLSWENLGDGDAGQQEIGKGAELEIDGAERKTITIQGDVKASKLQLKEGRYKWRLKTTVDGEIVRTAWNQFSVGELPPPGLRAPLNGTVVFAKAGGEVEVAFKWEELSQRLKVEVEVTVPGEASQIADSEGTSLVMPLKSGNYRWKARVVTPDGKQSAWTPERAIVVKDEAVKAAPAATQETAMALFTPGGAVTEAPKLVEPPKPAEASQAVEVPKPAEPAVAKVEAPKPEAKPVEAQKKPANPFKVQALLGVDEKGKAAEQKPAAAAAPTEPSKTEAPVDTKVEAEKKSEELAETTRKESSNQAETRLTEGASLNEIPVLLKWAPISGVKEYLLEIFNSKKDKLYEEKVKEPRGVFRIRSLSETNYNYQISAELKSGEKVSSGLVPVKLHFSPPVAKLPAKGSEVGADRPVLLIWEKTALTDFYQLQVARDPGFKDIVIEKQGTKNVEPVLELAPGTYYWRVKSVTQSKQSDWSKSSSFLVK